MHVHAESIHVNRILHSLCLSFLSFSLPIAFSLRKHDVTKHLISPQLGGPRQVSFPNGRATGIGPGRSAGAGVQPMDALPKVAPAAARKSGA